MKLFKTTITLLVLLLAGSQQAFGQSISKAGTAAAEFLRIPVGARASAMSAMTATVNDASAAIYNPAGLADVEGTEIMLEYTDWYLDINHTFLGVAMPVGKGVAGLSVVALNMGEFQETTVEAQGPTGRTFNAYSASVGGSYAQYLVPQFSIGGSFKFIYERIFNSSASTFAFDIGTMYETPFDGIILGVSITNAGSKLQIDGDDLLIASDPDPNGGGNYEPDAKRATEAFNLPLMLRVGLAWDPYVNENIRTTITVDGNSPSNNVQSLSVGGEIALMDEMIQLRGGMPYLGQDDRIETFNAGVGFRYKLDERLQLGINYTYHGYQYLSDVNKISLQIHF